MEYTLFVQTKKYLEDVAKSNPSILVGFSGGKDSWVCLDLCCRVFTSVTAFFLYLVPDLACVEAELDKARKRYGVEIRQYPHWLLFRSIKNGIYCDRHWRDAGGIWEPKINDLHAAIIADTGINLICQGAKEKDSMWRRRYFSINHFAQVIYPLRKWAKFDVLSYLRMNQIEIPESSGGSASGIDLSTRSLLWLHDRHPADFQRVLEYFPYSEAVVKRRDLYGIK
jgi:3'-phosphoadenosine 5'-phosphosulfate sulfotransferase (PAPS reductase)/FAD synthetase